MSSHTLERKLWVIESNGAPRSGKGTINAALAESFPDGAQDETGADYRSATLGMLDEHVIDPEMPDEVIEKNVVNLGAERISSYVALRYEITKERGEKALHTPVINDVVPRIGKIGLVRTAVKAGFSRRVTSVVNDPDVNLLFVDGRNLSPIIEKIEGASILLRLFVDCQPHTAALREAARQGIDLSSTDSDEWFQQTKASIKSRKLQDEQRKLDAVKPDEDAIRYWHNDDVMSETVAYLALTRALSMGVAARLINDGGFRVDGRFGAGAKAVAENRQVYLDTSEIGKEKMVSIARRMVEEALVYKAGTFVPLNPELFRQ